MCILRQSFQGVKPSQTRYLFWRSVVLCLENVLEPLKILSHIHPAADSAGIGKIPAPVPEAFRAGKGEIFPSLLFYYVFSNPGSRAL
jgi:hypothetical protein